MRSPLHPNSILTSEQIEPGLEAWRCPVSGGVWIPLQAYLRWQAMEPRPKSIDADSPSPELLNDSMQRALICPESGRLMLRYRVGHGLPFHLDRSPATGGVWLDAGEWEALRKQGLSRRLHLIFTAAYQRAVRSEEYQQRMEEVFLARIGAQDFGRVAEFKKWILSHPRRYEISCYLWNTTGLEEEQPPDLDGR